MTRTSRSGGAARRDSEQAPARRRLLAPGILVLAAVTAGHATAEETPSFCLGTRFCPPPLICSANASCVRPACRTASNCRSDADHCIFGECWSSDEASWLVPALTTYEDRSLSPDVGVMLSMLLPGLGNFYARDAWGVVPLMARLTGTALWLSGFYSLILGDEHGADGGTLMISGVVIAVAAGVAAPIWAWFAVEEYNDRLRREIVDAARPPTRLSGARLSLGLGSLVVRWQHAERVLLYMRLDRTGKPLGETILVEADPQVRGPTADWIVVPPAGGALDAPTISLTARYEQLGCSPNPSGPRSAFRRDARSRPSS